MSDYQILTVPNAAGLSAVSMSTTSAQSAVLKGQDVVCVVTALAFVIRGTNPTATAACLPLAPNVPYRLRGIQEGEKLAFLVPTGTGTAYLAQGV